MTCRNILRHALHQTYIFVLRHNSFHNKDNEISIANIM